MKKQLLAARFFIGLFSLALCCFLFLSPAQAESDQVNINTASIEELQEVTGIGPALAERIVEFRQEQEFQSKQDLLQVKGIGPGTLKKMEDMITY